MKRLFARQRAVSLEEITNEVQESVSGGWLYEPPKNPMMDMPFPGPRRPAPIPGPVPTFGINEGPDPIPQW